MRPPRRFRKPGMRRNAENFRGEEGRQVIGAVAAEPISDLVFAPGPAERRMKCGPGGINDERGETEKNSERLQPPGIRTQCLCKAALRRQTHFSHKSLNL